MIAPENYGQRRPPSAAPAKKKAKKKKAAVDPAVYQAVVNVGLASAAGETEAVPSALSRPPLMQRQTSQTSITVPQPSVSTVSLPLAESAARPSPIARSASALGASTSTSAPRASSIEEAPLPQIPSDAPAGPSSAPATSRSVPRSPRVQRQGSNASMQSVAEPVAPLTEESQENIRAAMRRVDVWEGTGSPLLT